MGLTQCNSTALGSSTGVHGHPTDSSGTYKFTNCPSTWPAAYTVGQKSFTSNQLDYLKGTTNPSGTPYTVMVNMDWKAAYNYTNGANDLATYGAGNTRLDDWINFHVYGKDRSGNTNYLNWPGFESLGMQWMIMMDWLYQYWDYTEVSNGAVDQYTPETENAYYLASSHYSAGQATSYEGTYGAAFDHIEANCGTKFQGYTHEAVYSNGLVWLYNRTPYWVMVKDYGGWTWDSATYGQRVVWNSATPTVTDWHVSNSPKFNYVDEIVIEVMYAGMPAAMIAWISDRNTYHPTVKLGFNIDSQWNGGSGVGYWAPKAVTDSTQYNGQTVSRNWWESYYLHQLVNYFVENYGPFDSFVFNPYQGGWFQPYANTLDYPQLLDQSEHMYINSTPAPTRVSVTLS